MNGFLNVMKPPGMTSSGVVVGIRRSLSGEKVGHAGTLDPEAAGVLPIMVGKAARLFDVLVDKQKSYIAQITFGTATDTQDAQGKAILRTGEAPTQDELKAALPEFVGNIMQTPPAFSALKVGGRTAYDMARQGEVPQLAPRPARVDAIELLEMAVPDGAMLRIDCGKGVYVRTLCHDIGARLGCGAHMSFLLRTLSGSFGIEKSVTLEEWAEAEDKQALLTPMDAPLSHLPKASVPEEAYRLCKNGNPPSQFEAADEAVFAGGPVRIYCGHTFAGIGTWREGTLRFSAMLLE